MKNLGINVISESKDKLKREVVFISKGQGKTRKGSPRLNSITFHQWKIKGNWQPSKVSV